MIINQSKITDTLTDLTVLNNLSEIKSVVS